MSDRRPSWTERRRRRLSLRPTRPDALERRSLVTEPISLLAGAAGLPVVATLLGGGPDAGATPADRGDGV